MNNTYFYKVINEIGNSLDGFRTEEEAKFFRDNQASLNHQWRVQSYKAEAWECN